MCFPLVNCQKESQYMIAEVKQKMKDESERFLPDGRKFYRAKFEDPLDAERLGHPQALTKFCYFLMDALKERGAKMKPLMCACLAQEPAKVLIVHVCGKPFLGAIQGNSFEIAFRTATDQETGDESS